MASSRANSQRHEEAVKQMIENRHAVLTSIETVHADGAEASWGGGDSNAEQAAVRAKRVLLVDDEESLRACLRMMLEMEGHQVTEARNGAEALHLFTLSEFDRVITDFQMPVMEGTERWPSRNGALTRTY